MSALLHPGQSFWTTGHTANAARPREVLVHCRAPRQQHEPPLERGQLDGLQGNALGGGRSAWLPLGIAGDEQLLAGTARLSS